MALRRCRPTRVAGLSEAPHDDELRHAGGHEARDALRGDAPRYEDRDRGGSDGLGGVSHPGAGATGLGRRGHHRSGGEVGRIGADGFGQLGRGVRGQPDDGVRPEDPPAQRDRCIVLADVDAVGAHLEGEVGSIVHHEGDAEVRAQSGSLTSGSDHVDGIMVLVAQLDDVDAARDAVGEERGEVGADRGAEVEAPRSEVEHQVAVRALAAAFIAALNSRTSSRLTASTMSATLRREPTSE